MSENDLYRHEDIEALLMSKAFSELLPEEKTFVLQHVGDAAEYTSMRDLLLEMQALSFDAELKEAPESLETALLHGFAEHAEKERGYTHRFSPWIGWAMAASVVGFCVLFFWPAGETQQTAEVKVERALENDQKQEEKEGAAPPIAPKPAVSVPNVVLPSEVERLLAEVVQATTPSTPRSVAELYEYEDAIKSVSLTQEESYDSEAPAEYAPVESDSYTSQEGVSVVEDQMSSVKPSAVNAPEKSMSEAESLQRVATDAKALGKANRKKMRNPDVLKLSQAKKLKALLRSE